MKTYNFKFANGTYANIRDCEHFEHACKKLGLDTNGYSKDEFEFDSEEQTN